MKERLQAAASGDNDGEERLGRRGDENEQEDEVSEGRSANLWAGLSNDSTLARSDWMSNAAVREESKTEDNVESKADYSSQRSGQEQEGDRATSNRDSEAYDDTAFASSPVEANGDFSGRKLDLEEDSAGSDLEDSGVAFPFLDHALQQENQVEDFGGANQADMENSC